jgi:hypothetical protein
MPMLQTSKLLVNLSCPIMHQYQSTQHALTKMNKMRSTETLRFASRFLLPVVIIVIITFLVIIAIFPAFRLTFRDFTFIYWGFSLVSFPLNYQARRWTDYIVNRYGPQMEKNPVMRKMYVKGDLRQYWVSWLLMYVLLFFSYILAASTKILYLFLVFPSCILAVLLYDFLNDFYWLRRLSKPAIEKH